jgi:hypothetical protein
VWRGFFDARVLIGFNMKALIVGVSFRAASAATGTTAAKNGFASLECVKNPVAGETGHFGSRTQQLRCNDLDKAAALADLIQKSEPFLCEVDVDSRQFGKETSVFAVGLEAIAPLSECVWTAQGFVKKAPKAAGGVAPRQAAVA